MSGIIAISNSLGESAYSWRMTFWIFTLVKVFLLLSILLSNCLWLSLWVLLLFRIIIININIISSLASFLCQRKMIVFLWILRNSKSPQVFRTLLGILANSVIWMATIFPPILCSSSLFAGLFRIVPCAPTTNSIILTLIFHNFKKFSGKV